MIEDIDDPYLNNHSLYVYIYKYMYIYTYLNDIASIYTNGNDPYFNVLFTHIL